MSGFTEIQAESFSRRQSGGNHQWSIVDQETLGAGTFSGSTGPNGEFLQALTSAGQDSTWGSVVAPAGPGTPSVEYDLQVTAPGTYEVKLRAAGISGASDSLWIELPTGTLFDAQGNSVVGNGLKIETSANGLFGLKNAGRWTLAAGTHTIRLSLRESGTALDAVQIVEWDIEPPAVTIPGVSPNPRNTHL